MTGLFSGNCFFLENVQSNLAKWTLKCLSKPSSPALLPSTQSKCRISAQYYLICRSHNGCLQFSLMNCTYGFQVCWTLVLFYPNCYAHPKQTTFFPASNLQLKLYHSLQKWVSVLCRNKPAWWYWKVMYTLRTRRRLYICNTLYLQNMEYIRFRLDWFSIQGRRVQKWKN